MIIEGYADYIVESVREKLGYSSKDSSHDAEVFRYLKSGEKLSKSKHLNEKASGGNR